MNDIVVSLTRASLSSKQACHYVEFAKKRWKKMGWVEGVCVCTATSDSARLCIRSQLENAGCENVRSFQRKERLAESRNRSVPGFHSQSLGSF